MLWCSSALSPPKQHLLFRDHLVIEPSDEEQSSILALQGKFTVIMHCVKVEYFTIKKYLLMASVKVFPRLDKADSQGKVPIYLRVTKNRKSKYIALNTYIFSKDWSKETGKVKKECGSSMSHDLWDMHRLRILRCMRRFWTPNLIKQWRFLINIETISMFYLCCTWKK